MCFPSRVAHHRGVHRPTLQTHGVCETRARNKHIHVDAGDRVWVDGAVERNTHRAARAGSFEDGHIERAASGEVTVRAVQMAAATEVVVDLPWRESLAAPLCFAHPYREPENITNVPPPPAAAPQG